MILINNKTNKAYILSKKEAASMIGVHRNTITRYSIKKTETYNDWTMYFDVKKITK